MKLSEAKRTAREVDERITDVRLKLKDLFKGKGEEERFREEVLLKEIRDHLEAIRK